MPDGRLDRTARARSPTMGFEARVRAVLGPTNTGKTHLAMERMLAHRSGMIGFPLRLLARENYDRMVAAKGARHVALITGEEKIVPPEAAWFSCTVEAMPLDRATEFVAVDEIQLCADPDRGHVFTDRLLHARGLVETMVMGAETIRPLLSRLVPGIAIETRPRLSSLAYAGHAKLAKLPPRSAIVAFSAGEVYAIAEAIRRRRGGCAVVMGRLSPRTRNAQVALYQDGEVDFLVATDAIGMGLNMDVNHVAFAGLSKFDGSRPRRLTAPEIAQIAGRAGRGMRDGTFGTTGECPPLLESIVEQVEQHRFEAIDRLAWRNGELDFSSPDALLATLLAPPPAPGLARGNEASDLETLTTLARDPEIRACAVGRTETRRLWEACQVPDFRKLADDTHARLCARIYLHLSREGGLPRAWIEQSLTALSRADGDIDTLMQRLSGVRVWAYIAARRDWTHNDLSLQTLAREVEDLLSDALHGRLTARFVDRRAAILSRRLDEGGSDALLSAVTQRGEVIVEGQEVGRVAGFVFTPDTAAAGDTRKLMLRAARRALAEVMPRRVASLAGCADDALSLDVQTGIVAWDGSPVARLRAGRTMLTPEVEPLQSEFLDGVSRERIKVRIARFVADTIERDLAVLFEARRVADQRPELRGPVHSLLEQAGLLAPGEIRTIAPDALRVLSHGLGWRVGRFGVFHPAILRPRAARLRALLIAVAAERRPGAPPPPGRVSVATPPDRAQAEDLARLGHVEAGPVMVRIDIAERVAGELDRVVRHGAATLPEGLAPRLGVASASLGPVLRGLGFRVIPTEALPEGLYGPPRPAMIASRRRERRVAAGPVSAPREGNPFAALAGWRASA